MLLNHLQDATTETMTNDPQTAPELTVIAIGRRLCRHHLNQQKHRQDITATVIDLQYLGPLKQQRQLQDITIIAILQLHCLHLKQQYQHHHRRHPQDIKIGISHAMERLDMIQWDIEMIIHQITTVIHHLITHLNSNNDTIIDMIALPTLTAIIVLVITNLRGITNHMKIGAIHDMSQDLDHQDVLLIGTEEERQKSTIIFTGNLPYDYCEQDVAAMFERYGKLLKITIPIDNLTTRNKGFAFVEFEHRHEAQEAFDNYQGFSVGGRRLKLDWDIGLNKKDNRRPPRSEDYRHTNNHAIRSSSSSSPPPRIGRETDTYIPSRSHVQAAEKM
ncbi:hypothetical protein BCR42DRAFT_75165 [Absidia repens]|uniref:RRM domain-containing protein n=1 Tax=Absidia repens TaxID=90262 RepID=A0A1X2IA59_9FUNG|nr:hypothetical protein BCR42DRAFT_75165 [Absidia repens]